MCLCACVWCMHMSVCERWERLGAGVCVCVQAPEGVSRHSGIVGIKALTFNLLRTGLGMFSKRP